MEKVIVNRIMTLINTLSIENKLEILTKLSENLKLNFNPNKNNLDKGRLLDELCGAWSDIDENLVDDIINSRSISDKKISFD